MRTIPLLLCTTLAFFTISSSFTARADEVLDRIRVRKLLVVGTAFNMAAFSYLKYQDKDSGVTLGYEPELAKAIAKAIGPDIQLKWLPTKWELIPDNVGRDLADIGLDAWFLPDDANTGGKTNWSEPYLNTGFALAYLSEKGKIPLEKLKTMKGVAYDDPKARIFLKEAGFKKIKYFDTEDRMYKEVLNKKSDFVVFDQPLLYYWSQNQGDKIHMTEGLLKGSSGKYSAYVKDGNPEFLALVNKTIKTWVDSKEARDMRKKWKFE